MTFGVTCHSEAWPAAAAPARGPLAPQCTAGMEAWLATGRTLRSGAARGGAARHRTRSRRCSACTPAAMTPISCTHWGGGRLGAHPQQALLGLRAGRLDADLLHALQQQLVLGLQIGHAALQRLDAQHLALARFARRLAVLRAPARARRRAHVGGARSRRRARGGRLPGGSARGPGARPRIRANFCAKARPAAAQSGRHQAALRYAGGVCVQAWQPECLPCYLALACSHFLLPATHAAPLRAAIVRLAADRIECL